MIRIDMSDLADAIDRTTQEIKESVNESTLRKVGFAGAEVFRDEVKNNALASKKTGDLHANIIVVRVTEESDSDVRQVYKVTVRSDPAYYWRWVEKGHKIVPKNTRVSRKTGRKIGWAAHRRAAEVEYGSRKVPAHPFVRPAYESKKTAATDAMTRTLSEILARNT